MDARPVKISKILTDLNSKFTQNLVQGSVHHVRSEEHEIRARVIAKIGELLANHSGLAAHQLFLAKYFEEIFGDMVCAIYFANISLDNPSRMMLRRALELSLVVVSYWDDPSSFWGWKEHNEDISFTLLDQSISGKGYLTYLTQLGNPNTEAYEHSLKALKKNYSELSNVVHPKPYNFETNSDAKFTFNHADLEIVLNLLESVQCSLLRIFLTRFNFIYYELAQHFPTIDKLTGK